MTLKVNSIENCSQVSVSCLMATMQKYLAVEERIVIPNNTSIRRKHLALADMPILHDKIIAMNGPFQYELSRPICLVQTGVPVKLKNTSRKSKRTFDSDVRNLNNGKVSPTALGAKKVTFYRSMN